MKPERLVLLGDGVGLEEVVELRVSVARDTRGVSLLVVMVGCSGSELMSKTSPERRMGRVPAYLAVRISRASVLMGMVEGVDFVLGWMVTQSTSRF
jgi:hypothetical protein